MPPALPASPWTSRFITTRDGLRLNLREIAARETDRAPVLCLPGLTRNGHDFDTPGEHIARVTGRRVITLDSRGRGGSDYDPDWKHYDLRVELEDLLEAIAALGIEGAVFLGTSRGGLLAMMLGAMRPEVQRGVILNDIGPTIEVRGLQRIQSYVGKLPTPQSFEAGAQLLREVFGAQFPRLSGEQWLRWAQRSWVEKGGGLVENYDRNIMLTLADLEFDKPLPDLWPIFGTIKQVPLLVIRGALSELLTQETAERMAREHPDGHLHVVPEEGHAPVLEDAPTLEAITGFLARLA